MASRQQEATAVSRRVTIPMTTTQLPRKYQAESFRIRKSLENRKAEFWQIKQKFPEKIPIIVERFSKERTLPILEKHKYLVPGDITMFQFLSIIRMRLSIAPTQSLYLMVNGRDLMNMSATIAEIWRQNHDDDGFLYMVYASQEIFGC